jgi:hypothetical protein
MREGAPLGEGGAPSVRGEQPSVEEMPATSPLTQNDAKCRGWEGVGAPPLKRWAAPCGNAPPLKRGTPPYLHVL